VIQEGRYKCPVCDREANSAGSIRMHYYHHHFKNGSHKDGDGEASKLPAGQCCANPNLALLGRTIPGHAHAIRLGYLLYCTACEELHKTLKEENNVPPTNGTTLP